VSEFCSKKSFELYIYIKKKIRVSCGPPAIYQAVLVMSVGYFSLSEDY